MGSNEKVKIEVDMDTARAIAGWQEIADGPKALHEALQRISDLEGKSSSGWARSLEAVVGKWASIAASIKVAKDLADAYFAGLQRRSSEQTDVTATVDAATREYFAAQRIFDPAQQAQARGALSGIAIQHKSKIEDAARMASVLAGFGVGRTGAEGDALGAMLELTTAATTSGRAGDPAQFAKAVAEIVHRSGQGVSGQNITAFGARALGLVGRMPGANVQTMEEYARVSSYAREAGMPGYEGYGLYAAIRGEYDLRDARTRFKGLLDDKVTSGEQTQLSRYRAQVRAAGGDTLGEYGSLLELGSESIASRSAESEAAFQAARFKAGKIGRDEARQRAAALINAYGRQDEVGLLNIFDDPGGPFMPESWFSTERRARMVANQLAAGRAEAEGLTRDRSAIERQIMGRERLPLQVRLLSPDGREIPHDTPAARLNQ